MRGPVLESDVLTRELAADGLVNVANCLCRPPKARSTDISPLSVIAAPVSGESTGETIGCLSCPENRFDMNKLARVAADSVGAAQCVSIKKHPDGMFNKAFLISMDDGQEVIAKVPNPNAGISHLTTASEVATMDFVCSS